MEIYDEDDFGEVEIMEMEMIDDEKKILNYHADPNEGRTVSLWSGAALIVGMQVGSGIFASPGPLLVSAGSVGAALILWVLTGVLSLFGALAYAELGSMMPVSGGEQPYLMAVYGTNVSFLFGWFSAVIGKPASIAIVLLAFAGYVVALLVPGASAHQDDGLEKGIAIALLLCLTLINSLSASAGIWLQNIATVLKLLALLIISISALVFSNLQDTVSPGNFNDIWANTTSSVTPYAFACYQGLWSYDGWNNLNFIGGELRNPSRNLPLAIVIGVPVVIVSYTLTNIAYFSVLPASIIKSSHAVARDFGYQIMGQSGAVLLTVCVVISTLGSANASIYTCARLTQSAATEKFLPFSSVLERSNSKFKTPVNSLLFQCALSILFIVGGSYETLINMYSWIIWLFYGSTVLGLIVLRLRAPEREWKRPFKSSIVTAGIFTLAALLLIVMSIYEQPIDSLIGGVILLAGLPIFYLMQWFRNHKSSSWREMLSFNSNSNAPARTTLYQELTQ